MIVPKTNAMMKGTGWKAFNPREPVRTTYSYQTNSNKYRQPRPSVNNAYSNYAPLEEIEHIWEEGSKRPKTQNEKCRRKNSTQGISFENTEVFLLSFLHQSSRERP